MLSGGREDFRCSHRQLDKKRCVDLKLRAIGELRAVN